MFTIKNLQPEDIQQPPVKGCRCTYCENMTIYGYAVKGHGSYSSHRLKGGDERHNPENYARLLLKEAIDEESFKEYVSHPGGGSAWWQSKQTELWYCAGRNPEASDIGAGHFIYCHDKRHGMKLATLCLPARDDRLPLASVVLAHYYMLTYQEEHAWVSCALSPITPTKPLPEKTIELLLRLSGRPNDAFYKNLWRYRRG